MSETSHYVLRWISDAPHSSRVPISAKIPVPIDTRLSQLAEIVGTSKTDVIIAALDIGEARLRKDFNSKTGRLPATIEEFSSQNPHLTNEELQDTYEAYLEHYEKTHPDDF